MQGSTSPWDATGSDEADIPGVPVSDDEPTQWSTGRLLFTVARMVEHAWNSHLAQWSLNHGSLAMLVLLSRGDDTQRGLATKLHVEDQTASRMAERLERLGYVARRRDETDRRARVVTLTPHGREILTQALRDHAGERPFLVLGDDGVADLRTHLLTLLERGASRRW